MFVLLGITLWAMAIFMLAIDLEASAATLFVRSCNVTWPAIVYGKKGNSRFAGGYEPLKILLSGWHSGWLIEYFFADERPLPIVAGVRGLAVHLSRNLASASSFGFGNPITTDHHRGSIWQLHGSANRS